MNPCQYSPEVLSVLADLIDPLDRVFDPFAGHGLRLGEVCDGVGAEFRGVDIEVWEPHDARVRQGDARHAASYPSSPFTVVTSPVYQNKRCADYANGPTPTTKTKGRRDYGIALGRPLHEMNLARHTGHLSRAPAYYAAHSEAVKLWGHRAIVNVDLPIAADWEDLLEANGYQVRTWIEVKTRRYGGLANFALRAPYEVVLVAWRKPTKH